MTEPIPILDLRDEIALLWDELNAGIQDVLQSGQFIMGQPVRDFETEVAAYLGAKHAIAVNSGTDAILIALRALGIGAGDEVLTTAFTFFASVEGISLLGATPVFVDIDPTTFNLDVDKLEAAITERTRAILPVHLFGQPAALEPLLALAQRHNLFVLEDCAQAFGACYHSRCVGTLGDAGAFSFFPTKNLGAYGDAGLITTDDERLAEVAGMLRLHGSKKKYHNELLGYNSRLDTLQAAILRVKLPHVNDWNDRRRAAAARYEALLADLPGLICPAQAAEDSDHVYHQYTVRITGACRDAVQQKLKAQGISTMIYYPVPVHQLPVYADRHGMLPVTEQMAAEVLSLPIWPHITPEQQERVAHALRVAVSPG